MKMLNVVPVLSFVLLSSACAGVRHNKPEAAKVRVVKNIAAVSDCEYIGMAKARGKWIGRDQRNIQLQNSGFAMGADTVLVVDKGINTVDEGRAYRCAIVKAEAN